jgi:hypothetical protein
MQISIKFPIKGYLKKYLAFTTSVEPYVLSTNDVFGNWLFPSMTKACYDYAGISEQEYDEALEVVIPAFYARQNRFIIDAKIVYRINQHLDKLFDHEMNRYLFRIRGLPRQQVKTHIINFRSDYGITEDDISYQTLKKRHQRFMKRLQAKKERI